MDLPGKQLKLLQAVVATGKPVVLVFFNGRPLAIPWEAEHVAAILEAWFPGVQAGPALVTDAVWRRESGGPAHGDFPRSVGQEPLYYNFFRTGRPTPGKDRYVTGYIDERNTPLFPFGWGLSYTTFDYSPTQITTPAITAAALTGRRDRDGSHGDKLRPRAGAEVVQLYICQRGTSVARPARELKGFQRIVLAPGEGRRVRFAVTKEELAFWNIDMKRMVEPGELTVWVAPHSQGGQPATIMIGDK